VVAVEDEAVPVAVNEDLTTEWVLEDGKTPSYCRGCKRWWDQCVCEIREDDDAE